MSEQQASWWMPRQLAVGQCWRAAIGPLTIYLQRQPKEWRLAFAREDEEQTRSRLECAELDEMPQVLEYSRYVFRHSPAELRLTPRLVDRPIVVRTSQPVHIPPEQDVTFYIGTPVCVVVELDQQRLALQELASVELSDTWFGPSTQVGEICYAAKTQARNSRSEVPQRPHRAITPVTIRNQSDALLTVEKLSLPVPFLAVYGLPDGSLWTEPLTLEHQGGTALAKVNIGGTPPQGASAEHWLTPAREVPKKGSFVRAFVDMFSE